LSLWLEPEAEVLNLCIIFSRSILDLFNEFCFKHYHQRLEKEGAERDLYDFDALTHGFGLKTLATSLRTFRSFIEKLAALHISTDE